MSTTSRGNQAQDDARALLEASDWIVETAKPSVRVRWDPVANDYRHEPKHDFFGVVDLIALNSRRARFIQVTHPSGVIERVAKIRARVPASFLQGPDGWMSWEVWARLRNGWQVTRVYATSKESSIVIAGSPIE